MAKSEALILLMVVLVYFIKHELLISEECIRPEDLSSKKSLHLSYPSDGSGIQNWIFGYPKKIRQKWILIPVVEKTHPLP